MLPTTIIRHGQRYVRVAAADPYGGCPVCGGAVARTCRCPLADSQCERGHQWHYRIEHFHQPNERRTLVLGPARHGQG